MDYSTYALTDLLDAFASNDPVPGGGSAAALTGALGVSLLIMVAGLPKTRHGTAEEAADLSEASARLRPLRERLEQLVDLDTVAYKGVMTAYRLPKATDDERAARRGAIAAAMLGATRTPLDTLRACQQALTGAEVIAANGATSGAADAAVAIELLLAAARGAALNVDANLPALKGSEDAEPIKREREELENEATAAAARARQLLPSL